MRRKKNEREKKASIISEKNVQLYAPAPKRAQELFW